MIHDVKEFFGLKKEFKNAGFFETDNYKMIYQDVVAAVKEGHLIAITGIVGSGKTVTARKIRNDLKKSNEVLVSTNLSVDKNRVKLGTLLHAMFADLKTNKTDTIPTKIEVQERELIQLIKRRKKPVALFIDEAHDLHHGTLGGLKRIQELVQEADALLSIVMVGHPRLSIDLNKPKMEEIGGRTTVMQLDGILGYEKEYVAWLLGQCLDSEMNSYEVFSEDAINFIGEKFSTPLQINHYGWNALVKAYQIGQKPVDVDILQEIISEDLDSIEANMKRSGYGMKEICEAVDARPAEIRSFFKNRLEQTRTKEIQDEILKLGIAGT
nr:AAA family ATPase [uncultured Desulfobacter sp.]